MGDNKNAKFVSTVDVVVANDEQARLFVEDYCKKRGIPKKGITFVRLEGNNRMFRIRDPEMEQTFEVMVDIFGGVHPHNN